MNAFMKKTNEDGSISISYFLGDRQFNYKIESIMPGYGYKTKLMSGKEIVEKNHDKITNFSNMENDIWSEVVAAIWDGHPIIYEYSEPIEKFNDVVKFILQDDARLAFFEYAFKSLVLDDRDGKISDAIERKSCDKYINDDDFREAFVKLMKRLNNAEYYYSTL